MGPGARLVRLFLPPPWSGSLVPRLWKGIPPTPLLPLARPSRLFRGSGGWPSRQEGGGRNLFPTFGWSTHSPFLPPGSCLFSFVLCAVCVVCFVSLSVLLARVVCSFVCFSFCLYFALCKTLDVDPGVSGTVVGFPVHPWSCVLLVLRLALSVLFVFVALRRVVFLYRSLLCLCLLG